MRRNDLQRLGSLEPRERLLIELDDGKIDATHDQQRRCADVIERLAGQVGTPTARDDSADPLAELGRRHERRRRPGARAEQPKRKTAHDRLPPSQCTT